MLVVRHSAQLKFKLPLWICTYFQGLACWSSLIFAFR